MKYNKEISAQVINNISLVESSKKVIEDVEDTLFKKLDEIIECRVEESGLAIDEDKCFSFYDEEDLYFSVADWVSKDKEQVAWYVLAEGPDECGYLTHALGEFSSGSMLRLQFAMNNKELGINKTAYKRRLHKSFSENKALHDLGFVLCDEGMRIELQFNLDKDKVAEEYPELDSCFAPLKNSLDTLFEAHPHFLELVDKMKPANNAATA